VRAGISERTRNAYFARLMFARSYDAILLDLDGTLVDDGDRIHPRTLSALHAADRHGVRVMVATGRSELATIPVLEQLGLESPAIVFNGAGLYCPVRKRLLEERVLSERTLARCVQFGEERGHMTVAMCQGVKYATSPRSDPEWAALRDMTGVQYVERGELIGRRALRVTLFSDRHASSQELADEFGEFLGQPVYVTHFPLSCLPHHRASRLLVCDIHPPCKGKAEGLRVLNDEYGVPAQRVVAVGDAENDVPMIVAAGLGVAMGNAYPEALAAAKRVIGSNDTGTIGELVEELFLGG
jgi:Cof subfamily protein (haloacid dehalogenase superfamily)